MKHFLTGMLISGICTMSPLYAFGPVQGSNWGMPMMNWSNIPNWNNPPATYWGNTPNWNNPPAMNWGNTPNWNNAPTMNWGNMQGWNNNRGNTQPWPSFNFGNSSWPTMPTVNWQNTPTWNGYPTLPGTFQNRNMPAPMTYQPVVPVRILPAPANGPARALPIPPPKVPEIPAQVPPPAKPEKMTDAITIQQEKVPKPADGTPVFPTADDIPSELKDIKE